MKRIDYGSVRSCLVYGIVLLTPLFLAPRPAPAQEDHIRRRIEGGIEQLESQLRGDLPPQEETRLLWQIAQRARLVGDSVRVRYALSRLMESPGWSGFPMKRDALLQAALIEESQSRFPRAAEIYGRIVKEELPRPAKLRLESAYVGYSLRWADCLERAGDNGKAAEIYWDLITDLPNSQQTTILVDLIRNYRYGRPSREDIARLADRVQAANVPLLEWKLAQMYTAKGMFDSAVALFSNLWPDQAGVAVQYLDDILVAFRKTGRLQALLDEAESRTVERPVARFLASAYQRLGLPKKSLHVIKQCQTEVANALAARLSTLSATERISIPASPRDLTPELDVLEYQALQAVGDTTAAVRLAQALLSRRPREIRWYESVSDAPGVDVVSLWRSYVKASGKRGGAYQRAAQALADRGYATPALSLLKEGASTAPGLATGLAYADALISAGSVAGAWKQYRRIRTRDWADDDFLAEHVMKTIQETPSARGEVLSLLRSRLTQPPKDSWEERILRNLLFEEGKGKGLLDWVSLDGSGLAAIRLAQWALYKGQPTFALQAYKRVPPKSRYQNTARIEMARILRDIGAEDIGTYRRIGELLDPIVQNLSVQPKEPASSKRSKMEILDLWARVKLSGKQGMEVLQRLYKVFGQDTKAIVQRYPGINTDQIFVLRGLALSQVGSLSDAVSEFRAVKSGPWRAEADFYEARALFWQEEFTEAQSLFERLVTDPAAWRFTNDGLQYLSFLSRLSSGSLDLLAKATYLVWQGRWDDAEPILRDLSVQEHGEDIGEWARYMMGRAFWFGGETQRALTEWTRLSQDGSYGWLRDRLDWELASNFPLSATSEIGREGLLKGIVSSGRENLFDDLARLELKHPERFSTPLSDRVPGDV